MPVDLEDHAQLQMVMQIVADARLVERNRDAELRKVAPPDRCPTAS